MLRRYRCATVVATLFALLSAALASASAKAQEPVANRLPAAASPRSACGTTLQVTPPGERGSRGWSSAAPDGRGSEAAEFRDIQQRLLRLEAQNAEVVRQNEQLRSLLAAERGIQRLPQPTRTGDVMPAAATEVPADAAQAQAAEIAAGMAALKSGMEKLGAGVEELGKNLTVTTANKECGFKLAWFGALSGEMILADARPLIPSAVSLVSPDFGQDTRIAQISGKSSYLGAAAIGPSIGDLQSGGLIHAYFYSSAVSDDAYGFFVARAYGELKNDCWRFSVGVDGDVVNPLDPGMIDWAAGRGAGNIGFLRAQFRTERYFHLSDQSQVTAQFALTDPIPTNYKNFDFTEGLTESNGWPNVEGRLALGLGSLLERGGVAFRPVELGVSGLVGQLRRTGNLVTPSTVADVWALGADASVAVTDRLGVKGEFYHGQTVGTYLGAIIQNFNANRQEIRSTGAWGEIYYYWTPCLHLHFGYGIDDPLDGDLTAGLPRRNQFYFGNIIWDVTKSLDVGFEVSRWETAYMPPLNDNSATVFDTRVRIKF